MVELSAALVLIALIAGLLIGYFFGTHER